MYFVHLTTVYHTISYTSLEVGHHISMMSHPSTKDKIQS